MGLSRIFRPLSMHDPGFFGAVLCAVLSLGFTACQKKGSTPDWDTSGGNQSSVPAYSGKPVAKTIRGHGKKSVPAPESENPVPSTPESERGNLRFITYNVENWLTMDRYIDNQQVMNRSKPDSEKNAVIKIIASNNPDVIGVCEVGEPKDLAEIQKLLKDTGLDLPYSQYTGGADPERHLGLLSRFPIVSTAKPAETEYQLNGRTLGIKRGILDVTIPVGNKIYRFVGVHLKSKLEVEGADQENMRIHEAHLLRKHLDSVLQSTPNVRLIIYGDFNDTYPSKALRAVTYSPEGMQRIIPIYLKDSRGEAWTQHWKGQDIYTRIDYVMVSNNIKPEVVFRESRIIDDPLCEDGSDHRPLLAVFR